MELNLKKKKTLKINISEDEHIELVFPTIGRVRQYDKELRDESVDKFDAMTDMLTDCGMENEMANSLDMVDLGEILTALVSGKGK